MVNCVSKDGNLLLNVGPDSQGKIPEQSIEVLEEIGKWMSVHKESIYGCGQSNLSKPDWGYFTKKEGILYAHVINPTIGHLTIKGLSSVPKEVITLSTGKKAAYAKTWWGDKDFGNFFINVTEPTYLTYQLPDKWDTVFKMIFK